MKFKSVIALDANFLMLKLLEKALDPGIGTEKPKLLRSKKRLTSNQIIATNCTTWKSQNPEQKPQEETLSTSSPTLKTHKPKPNCPI
jgi:hypothetical protein